MSIAWTRIMVGEGGGGRGRGVPICVLQDFVFRCSTYVSAFRGVQSPLSSDSCLRVVAHAEVARCVSC